VCHATWSIMKLITDSQLEQHSETHSLRKCTFSEILSWQTAFEFYEKNQICLVCMWPMRESQMQVVIFHSRHCKTTQQIYSQNNSEIRLPHTNFSTFDTIQIYFQLLYKNALLLKYVYFVVIGIHEPRSV